MRSCLAMLAMLSVFCADVMQPALGQDKPALAANPLDKTLVTLGFLSVAAELKPGQNVVTSDLGGIFPKGIPVGKIADVRPVEFGLGLEASVKVAANLSALEEVWVLIP